VAIEGRDADRPVSSRSTNVQKSQGRVKAAQKLTESLDIALLPKHKGLQMSRTDQRRRRLLRAVAPVAGLLAVGLLVWQGSYAAFSATTNNTGDAWATGNLNLSNNGGTAIFNPNTIVGLFGEVGIKPGVSGFKCITVNSAGSLAGGLHLYRGALSGSANNATLAANLNLTVDAMPVSTTGALNAQANCSTYTGGTAGALFAGTLSALPTTYATSVGTNVPLAGGSERVAYRIGWTMPVGVSDNTLQGSNVITDLDWEVQ
jgi:hypothetical protein